MTSAIRRVLVTGAGGNLGAKAVEAFAAQPWCEAVLAFHSTRRTPPPSAGKIETVAADLSTPGPWQDRLADVDAVVHFAALNPVPDSSWAEATASFDMTAHLGFAALKHGVKRFVFCSSNHAMGGYKDGELAAKLSPGGLTEDLPPAPGTHWHDGTREVDSTAYGSSKAYGERFTLALAEASGGRLTGVSLRVGWTQPGDNDPRNISISGSPDAQGANEVETEEDARTLRWFRNMWMSNRDFEQLVLKSVTADASGWPAPAVVVNGNSDNEGSDWSREAGRRYLGYAPEDDLYDHVRR